MSQALALAGWTVLESSRAALGTTYYVSPTGNDNSSGTSPGSAWQSVTKVDDTTFNPGDQILFQDGGNWHGSLLASSSGTTAAPIVYGSYGSGADPTFWGSDVVPATSFQPVTGTTYSYSTSTAVNSFFVNDQFTHSASLVSGQTTDAGNISYVESNPNSWYYSTTNQQLYVNTGSTITAGNGNVYSAATRDNVVNSNQQSNVVFQNLETNESAKANAGYGFYIWQGSDVTMQNCVALNGGKHNVAVINEKNAIVNNTLASGVMPDQGNGGATAFVSYSDYQHTGDTSIYNNDTVLNYPGQPAFVDHADNDAALVSIQLNNFTTTAPVSVGIGSSAADGDHAVVNGGTFINTSLAAAGNTTVNGVTVTGPNGYIGVSGYNNVVENSLIVGANPSISNPFFAAFVDNGQNTVLRDSTIVMDPAAAFYYTEIALASQGNSLQAYGNILDGGTQVLVASYQSEFNPKFGQPNNFKLAYNLIAPVTYQFGEVFGNSDYTLAQLQAAGLDVGSILGTPQFVNTAAGNYALLPTSAGYLMVPLNSTTMGDLADILGQPRPQSGFDNPGAFTVVNLSWNNSGGGDGATWDSMTTNWTNAAGPDDYTDGANVTFNDSNNGHYSVTLNTTVSPASVTFNSTGSYTLSGSGSIAGAGAISKSGTGTVTIKTANSYTGGTTVSAGTLIAGVNGALGDGPVSITGGTLKLGASTGLTQLTSLSITGNGTFDINNNHVIINYGSGTDPIASIAALIASGYHGGAWNGTGIISSAAQTNGSYGIGYADSADAGNPAGLASGTIEMKYTLLGDTNLDGIVNGIDFGIVAADFNQGNMRWDQGDFDYNGIVSGVDFGDVAANFNKGTSGATAQWDALVAFARANGLMAEVPEPGSITLLAGAAGLMAKRHRKRK